MEKEVESGMEKAKEEVKKDMGREIKDREERGQNIVLYGLEESSREEAEERKEEDRERVKEVMKALGMEQKAGEIEVRFRAGKKSTESGARPRPLIVKVNDDETRERIHRDARKLARAPETKNVFVAQDLTWAQREEAKKEEKRLREEADRKTEEARKEGKEGKFLVVGQRGRRRVVWTERTE